MRRPGDVTDAAPSMLGFDLVRPLETDWRESLDDVAKMRRWPTSHDVSRLARHVKALSAAYNDPTRARATAATDGAARLGFFFARDVPKSAAAVRELVSTGAIGLDRDLRVLDLGAGMGAATWGIARAIDAAGGRGKVEATWVDPDRTALEVGVDLLRHRQGAASLGIRVDAVAESLTRLGGLGSFDLIVASGLLSELDVVADGPTRVERHATLLAHLIERHAASNGSLVIVEPALRDRTRHLHAVRNALLTRGHTVFAPCLHSAPCPALERPPDWCHDDLRVDLPPWLIPVARASGLRYEGLTLAYLVIRRDGMRLADALACRETATRARVVSEAMRSKGKRDAFLCGEFLTKDDDRATGVAARVRATRLDREGSELNAAWESVGRGDLLVFDPPLRSPSPRIGAFTAVRSVDRTPPR